MDSLRVLRDSLDSSRPPAGPSKRHEKRLNQEFKAAALHLTNLYRNSLSSSQSSHRLGYLQGLSDILDLILLRTSSTSREPSSLDDTQGEASHKELVWLVQYLRARIEAIKSESDEDDLDGDVETQSQQPTSSQPSHHHRSAATRATSAAASSSQRAASSTPGLPIDQDEERHSPAVSTAPNTPGPRSQRMDARESRSMTRSYEGSADNHSVTTPARQAPPSSSFSFSMASSPVVATMGASPSTFLRRKTRGISAQQGGSNNSAGGVFSGRGGGNVGGATTATTLSPVGEERSDSLMDEDMREDRGHGRRGPVARSDGDRGKRRKKVVRGAASSNSGAGGGGGGGAGGAGAGGQGGSSGEHA